MLLLLTLLIIDYVDAEASNDVLLFSNFLIIAKVIMEKLKY